jgi:hypothetical protein
MKMAKKEKDLSKIRNPTGKGGIQERPEDAAKAVPAKLEKLAKEKQEKALLFQETLNQYKQRLDELSLIEYRVSGKIDAQLAQISYKSTISILDIIAKGCQDGILEKSDIDEWGTKDEKHQELIDNYLKVVEENKELKRRLAQLESDKNKLL